MFMHQKNILHRDIKSMNMFLMNDTIVKLGDFGISKTIGSGNFTNTVVGTPYFMPPEVCKGENYNKSADIWSIGCLMYELSYLKRPFNGDNPDLLFN